MYKKKASQEAIKYNQDSLIENYQGRLEIKGDENQKEANQRKISILKQVQERVYS